MSTLSEFLLARIAEDEQLARAAAATEGVDSWAVFAPEENVPDIDGAVGTMPHVVRHDPARVLAECEAKRRIVEMIWASPLDITTPYGRERLYTLFHLAAPYADHPDWREEWRL